jgi:hypothetical protein
MKFHPSTRWVAFLAAAFLSVQRSQAEAAKAPPICTRVRFFAAPGSEKEPVGGTFAGSNVSRDEGFETLAEIKTAPASGQWTEIACDNKKVYRWLRYAAAPGSHGTIGKVEFYSGDELIAADGKGPKYTTFIKDPAHAAHRELDKKTKVWIDSSGVDALKIGFDLSDAATAQRPSFQPGNTVQAGPVDVSLHSSPGAVIRYTLDGTWPTETNGKIYDHPIHIDKTSTIQAVAFMENRAPSVPSANTYLIGESGKHGLSSAHVGNSLTGTTAGFPRFARTAGYDHKAIAFLRGGALTSELWALASGTYVSDKRASEKEEAARKRGAMVWEDYWKKVGPVDLITVQPRDFNLAREAESDINFFRLFRQKSPDLQPWLYCEWVEMNRQRPSDKGEVPSYEMKKLYPALTWEESMGAMLLYMEELQHKISETYHEGKRPRIIPAALAMGWIRNMIDHGKLPGISPGSFYPLLFNDQVHPASSPAAGSSNGGFLVDCTWFGAFYRKSPERNVVPIETTFTPEQAAIVQRLAWDVIKNYPDCGLYEEGTTPCGQPEFQPAAAPVRELTAVTLASSTPGAWFRYTLDGTPPTRTSGYVYCGVISVRPGMTVKAIAYKSGMADSPVSEAAFPGGE